jgi:outer membrane protein, heavy metal efflux system
VRIPYFFFLFLISTQSIAQPGDSTNIPKDSVLLSLNQVDSIFLRKNFQLLAQKYNISMADASIIQAKLRNNPILNYENVLYNPNNHRLFDYSGQNGEMMFQIQQLISTAGKRSKLIKLAEFDKSLQLLAFEDLLRILRLQVYTDYAAIYSGLKKLNLLRVEEKSLTFLVEASNARYVQGAISGYELIRIEYELQALRSSIKDQLNEILNTEAELKLFLQMDGGKMIIPDSLTLSHSNLFSYQIVIDSAFKNRPDFNASKIQIKYQEENYSLQRALAIPNVTVGSDYDRFGSAFTNYVGVNMAITIPLLNRNQGNIKIASLQSELAKAELLNINIQLQQEVSSAYDALINSYNLYKKINSAYRKTLSNILSEAISRYQQRVIGLLDFIDKIRTYENSQLNLIDLEVDLFLSKANLNYVTNSQFYK